MRPPRLHPGRHEDGVTIAVVISKSHGRDRLSPRAAFAVLLVVPELDSCSVLLQGKLDLASGSRNRLRKELLDLMEQARAAAARFDASLVVGTAVRQWADRQAVQLPAHLFAPVSVEYFNLVQPSAPAEHLLLKVTHCGETDAVLPALEAAAQQYLLAGQSNFAPKKFDWFDFAVHRKAIQPHLPDWVINIDVVGENNVETIHSDQLA